MRKSNVEVAAGLTLGLAAAGAGCEKTLPTATKDPTTPFLYRFQAELDAARAATARYQDVSVALREGFVATPRCVTSPLGTMGIHYVNASRLGDRLTAAEPEVLLYLPENGRLRLVAIEYVKPILENGQPYMGSTPPANPGTTPALFGQRFQGPMAGHAPGESWHHDLHVWIWAENPAGQFAQFNPQLSCP